MGSHNVVVLTGQGLPQLLRWNDFCHARSIAFIATDIKVRRHRKERRRSEREGPMT